MTIDRNALLKLYPEYTTVLGPYMRKDNRRHVVLYNPNPVGNNRKRKTISYPKALVEIREGRRLTDSETIDHVDRDKTNDNLDNLQILERSKHSALDAVRVRIEDVACPICGAMFTPSVNQRGNGKRSYAGPFCSKTCAGKYGASVQQGGAILERSKLKKEYFQQEK